jgi:hypothetical protein
LPLPFEILADRAYFLLLLARRFAWLIENIAWEPIPAPNIVSRNTNRKKKEKKVKVA